MTCGLEKLSLSGMKSQHWSKNTRQISDDLLHRFDTQLQKTIGQRKRLIIWLTASLCFILVFLIAMRYLRGIRKSIFQPINKILGYTID